MPPRRAGAAAGGLERAVLEAFTTAGHPVAFSTPSRVAKHFGIGLARAKAILEKTEGYTLHREYKKPRQYNPYYVHGRRKQVQADLIDVSDWREHNGGTRYLLVLIDIFTKFLWVYPLKNKSARSMVTALRSWLGEVGTPPTQMVTDRGLEFTAAPVQALLNSHNIEWRASNGTLKACIAERVNKTLQVLVFKHMTENQAKNYVDALPELVRTYNTRGHRTLEGMTPAEADRPDNEARVQAIFHERYEKLGRTRGLRKLRFRVGDMVRVKIDPKKISKDRRAYAWQFNPQYYRVVRINRTLAVPMYHLRALDDGEYIEGGFYGAELQRVDGNVFLIERVVARRVRNGRREILVKWMYWSERWNEWIPEASVRRVY